MMRHFELPPARGQRHAETPLPLEYSMNTRTMTACALAVATALAAFAPGASRAETPDEWHFNATIYGWLPDINMDLSFPTGGSSAEVTASDILDALNFTFMGALGAQKGKWGLWTDVIYLDLGSSTKQTKYLTIGGQELPAATGKVDLTITGWLWTTVGTYRVVDHPTYQMDVLAGARMLDMSTDLKWSLTGDLGDPPLLDESGKSDASMTNWDGIVGVRGRAEFGDDHKWFVPYYLDIGAGDSDFTWQAIAGVGYSFGWGDVLGVWRYLDYDMPNNDPIQNADFNGPAIGVTFHF
jgi:hypothetical protein